MNAKAGEHRRSEIWYAALTLQSLRVTIGPFQASTTSLESQESYLTAGMLPYNRNVTLQTFLSSTRDFYRLHSTFARLYNAAASPASRLRSAGSLAKTTTKEKPTWNRQEQWPVNVACENSRPSSLPARVAFRAKRRWGRERRRTAVFAGYSERGSRAESKNCEILLLLIADRHFDTKCPTGRASLWVKFPTVRGFTRVKCPGIARGDGLFWNWLVHKQKPPFSAKNMLGYLSAGIICSEKRTVFRERSSRKTVSYEEQIMSKNKYPNIFSPQKEALSLLSFKSFSQRAQFWKLGDI